MNSPPPPNEAQIRSIERPSSRLLAYYVIRASLFPLFLVVLPYHYFRYHTMRYRFDGEGVMMSWGVLFRREITLTYSRIQDIHLTSNFVQRWLGLANLEIQTASGSTGAEMMIEGCLEFEAIRDFLYTKMRGFRASPASSAKPASGGAVIEQGTDARAIVDALLEVSGELRRAREALDQVTQKQQKRSEPS